MSKATDRKILELLAADGRMSFTDLGKATGLSTSAVHQRVKRLEQRGLITAYGATRRPRAARPAADGVHLDPPDRPLPARRLARPARARSPRSSPAGRSPATSPTSSRCGSPRRPTSRTCWPGSGRPPTSPPGPRSCSARRTRTARSAEPPRPSVRLQRRHPPRGLGHLGGLQRGLVEVAVLGPPLLAGLGQRVDRVVVLVGARQRLGVVASIEVR